MPRIPAGIDAVWARIPLVRAIAAEIEIDRSAQDVCDVLSIRRGCGRGVDEALHVALEHRLERGAAGASV